MQNLILIGGGGYCKSCIDVIQGAELSIAPQLPNASAFVSLFQIVRLPCLPNGICFSLHSIGVECEARFTK